MEEFKKIVTQKAMRIRKQEAMNAEKQVLNIVDADAETFEAFLRLLKSWITERSLFTVQRTFLPFKTARKLN